MKKRVDRKGLQALTFAILIIGLVILVYYSNSIAGLIINNNNYNETEILTFTLNQFLPLTTKLIVNNGTFSLQALLQDRKIENITVNNETIFGYNINNLTINLNDFNLTPGCYNFTLIDNNTIIATRKFTLLKSV